jgi:hypothetical protein
MGTRALCLRYSRLERRLAARRVRCSWGWERELGARLHIKNKLPGRLPAPRRRSSAVHLLQVGADLGSVIHWLGTSIHQSGG